MSAPRGAGPARHRVVLGLGANLGDPAVQLARALHLLGGAVHLEVVSSLYRTAPVGFADQPDFLNLVCAGHTALAADALLREIRRVEEALGRVRTHRDAPRLIDVDILDFDGTVRSAEGLELPHPRLHLRAFVLAPLAEALPEWRHPLLGATAAELLGALPRPERVERMGPPPSVA